MIIVQITGASGSVLGVRLIESLLAAGETVSTVVSKAGWAVMRHELGPLPDEGEGPSIAALLKNRGSDKHLDCLTEYEENNFRAPFASGSSLFDAIVVMPCSMKTLSAIAHGYANTLITRACDVAIKENRLCVIVPRETPLSLVHIENMHKAALAGVKIVPPVPGFYSKPKTIDDVVDFVVGKIMNLLGIKQTLLKPWDGN